ncbi:endonuclease domain-containing protein [Roseibium sp.]|uniref:endonuclease domain-containing protein n=1 Tax=Roseibium sp. TaxID=1936156 RepID=UPI003B5039E4
MTNGEQQLWLQLRQLRKTHGIHVRRQAPIGPYVADFASHSAKLIIEVDGEHHQSDLGLHRDLRRDTWFKKQGYRTLRLSTGDLMENREGCLQIILKELGIEC